MSEDADRDVAAETADESAEPKPEPKVLAQMRECDTGSYRWKLNNKFLMVERKGHGVAHHIPVEEFGMMLGAFGIVHVVTRVAEPEDTSPKAIATVGYTTTGEGA